MSTRGMTVALFYTTNAAVLLLSLLAAWGIFFHGRRYNGDLLLLRCFAAAIFTVFALQRASLFSIVRPEGIEIYASQPIVLLCITFILLTMGGSAVMRCHHHQNLALWGFMLLIPAAFLLVNTLMITSGLYQPLFGWDDLLSYRVRNPIVFFGRVIFVAFLIIVWLFAAGLMAYDYMADRRDLAARPLGEDADYHDAMVNYVLLWAVIILLNLVPICSPVLAFHIIYNVLLVVAFLLTAFGYRRLMRYLWARDNGRLAPVLIVRRVPVLLGMEHGGTTPWGVKVERNPFFSGNPLLDNVAQALGVRSADISEHVAALNTNLVAWVSDQRLRHSAVELAQTDRKIIEISMACGYNDLPTFTRAFKRQFGQTPSEYRKQEQGQDKRHHIKS